MRTSNLIIVLILLSNQIFSQQLSLSLKEAVNLALEKNSKIFQAKEKISQSNLKYYSAWGNFLPSFNFGMSYNHLNQPLEIDLSPIREVILKLQSSNMAEFANISNIISTSIPLTTEQKSAVKISSYNSLNSSIPPFSETLKKQNFYNGNFTLIQPLFLGGKLLAVKKAAFLEKNAAKIEYRKTIDEVTSDVISSYLRVVLLEKVVKVRKNLLSGIEEHKSNAEKLFNEGIIAYNQLLKAEVAKSEAEQKLAEDENNLKLAVMSLAYEIGISDTIDINVTDSLSLNDFNFSVNNVKSFVNDNQPILQLIAKKQELAKQNYNAKRSAFLPTISAFGKYEVFPQYLSALEPRLTVGVQLSINLFNGFKDYLSLQEAKSIENELVYKKKELENKIFLWFNKSLTEIANNKNKFIKNSKSKELATENFRINKKRFATGMGSSIEVIDAELSLEKAELETLSSVHDYYLAINQVSLVLSDFNLFFETFYSTEKK